MVQRKEKKQIHLWVDNSMYEDLRTKAFKLRVSIAEFIRRVIKRGLDEK